MTYKIDYEKRIQNALRHSIRQILEDVANDGLPGAHHFYITFKSQFPGVEMSKWLFDSYPDEMTIVIQNWFEDLTVSEEKFSIILNFNNSPEKMIIPFQSILNFSDPSVNFSLQFEVAGDKKIISAPEINIEMPEEDTPSKKPQMVNQLKKSSHDNKKNSSDPIEHLDNVIDFEQFRKTD